MKSQSTKTVIITGASSGIGRACALAFADEKFNLALAARNAAALEETAADIRQNGGRVILLPTDVSREAECRLLAEETMRAFGRIDVLVNNAGISMRALFEETDLAVLKKIMDVNFWGTVYCTKYALPHLLESRGSVIGISSIAGKKGLPGRTGYSASKFAMEGFLETIRMENLKRGLHVLVACPGFTNTGIRKTALTKDGSMQEESPRDEKSMMTPEEVAGKIVKAYLRRKRDLVLTTEGKLTVLINKFFPSFMDRMVFNHMAREEGSPFK